ncbi:helix-turn-helix domain-containing protein [Streptomyces sp. NPDC056682]|uniref:helix-turn-helix domain-containing protein n=1 Tax=Streptomyces sp. NPDC056682 TaxID=3345909 RepID=UPI0036913D1F
MTTEQEENQDARRCFAEELKSARELHPDGPMTQTAVGRQTRTSKSTISRVESGTGPIPAELPAGLDQLFRTDGKFKRLYEEVVAATFPALYQRRMTLERSAVEIREWSQTVVPGLLQTPEYAGAILRKGDPRASDAEIAKAVHLRMARQAVLNGASPPVLRVVLCESVLRRLLAPREVMRAQFETLLAHSARPTTSVRVLPLDADAHLLLEGSASFLTAPNHVTVVCVEAYRTAGIVDDPEHVRAAEHAYDEITGEALTRRGSAQLIRDEMERMT